MSTGRWSLRRRLLVAIGGAALLGWCASSFWLYSEAIAETDRGFDVALDHAAHAVLAIVAHEIHELRDAESGKGIELAEIDHLHGESIVYQVRGPGGGIAYRSPGAPVEQLARQNDRGFAFVRASGRGFRVETLATEDGAATIHVAQPLDQRDAVANAVALKLLAPGAALLAVVALTVGWTVRAAAEPLIRYSRDLDRRALAQTKPVDSSGLPDELQPVARAIDRLLVRVRDALLHERTLTADAAHELRTPLAALRLQAQVARRSSDAGERAAALDELLAGTDRAARLADSVLTLARYDAQQHPALDADAVDIAQLTYHVAREFMARAAQRGLTLELAVAADTRLAGDQDALGVALRNLIDNALRFARSRVRIEASAHGADIHLTVLDDGPGMPPQTAGRAFDRFFRGDEEDCQRGPGAGLGLALVRRVAELHRGHVLLVDGIDGGCGVKLQLPVMPQAQESKVTAR
jgi:two-component system sensor histidine kinase QseC